MTRPLLSDASAERKRMLKKMKAVVQMCKCRWPLEVMRNGDGHADDCPAHTKIDDRWLSK